MEITKDFLEDQLNGLKAKLTDTLTEKQASLKEELDAKLKALETLSTKDELQKALEEINVQKERIDALAAKRKEVNEGKIVNFKDAFAKDLSEKHNDFKASLEKGEKANLTMKSVTINTNNSLTGDITNQAGGALINQLNEGIILPAQLVNFDQLVSVVQGTQDTIRYWREVASANAIAAVNKGAAKPPVVFDFTPVVETAGYTAGIYRFEKSMFRNLPWMQARLPQMLRRDFYKKQNADYFTKLAAAISSVTSTNEGIIALIDAIGELESADFPVNGIVLNPADYASLTATRSTQDEFTLPNTVTFDGGILRVNGVPAFKATWIPVGEFLVGDWSQAYKYVTDSLKVEFFEQDVDNAQKNAITSRIEESNVLVIEQPLAFRKGVFTQPEEEV